MIVWSVIEGILFFSLCVSVCAWIVAADVEGMLT